MTAYFDNFDGQILRIQQEYTKDCKAASDPDGAETAGFRACEALDKLEDQVVTDAGVAAEFPGFPADLRERVHMVILRRGHSMRPLNDPPREVSTHERFNLMRDMVWDLHTVFHEVAKRGLEDFNDSPLTPILCLRGKAESCREEMVERATGKKPPWKE